MQVTEEKLLTTANKLKQLYDTSFRGKSKGNFSLTRSQLVQSLGVKSPLKKETITRLEDQMLSMGIVMVDTDSIFSFMELKVVKSWRKPPKHVMEKSTSSLLV